MAKEVLAEFIGPIAIALLVMALVLLPERYSRRLIAAGAVCIIVLFVLVGLAILGLMSYGAIQSLWG